MPLMISRIGQVRGLPVAQVFGKCGAITRLCVGQIGLVSGDDAAMLLSASTWLIQVGSGNPFGITAGATTQAFSKTAADKGPED
jgi:hypothetical protein